MPGDVLTSEELLSYALNGGAMPPKYVNASPATIPGTAGWRLLDADHISTGIMDPNRLGTGSTGAGNLYLADDGTWKVVSTSAGGLPPGGTDGQILAKIDSVDFNTEWIDNYTSQVKHEVKLGATLSKGTPVYVSGSTGGSGTNMIVSAASNATEATSSKTMGLLESGGVTNDFVFVVTEGLIAGVNTGTATAGDPVWLGPSGTLLFGLASKPVAPVHMVFIGIVTRVHAVNGEIFVKVQNGFELEELHNVAISSLANNDLLVYESGTSLWKNKTFTAIFGGTPLVSVPTLQQVTTAGYTTTNPIIAAQFQINGTTRNARLSSDNVGGFDINYNIGGTPDWRWFGGGTTALTTFKANGNVLVGTTADAGYKLDVSGSGRYYGAVEDASISGTLTIATANSNLRLGGNTTYSWIQSHSSKPLYINELGNNVILNLGGGGVGIGTASPSAKLHVADTMQLGTTSNASFSFRLTRTSGAVPQDAHFYAPTNNSPSVFYIEGGYYTGEAVGTSTAANSGYPYYERYFGNGSTSSYKHLGFINVANGSFGNTNLIPSIALLSTGNVGFGTTSPTYKVDVRGTTLAASTISAQGAFNIFRVAAPTGTLTLTPSAGGSVDVGQHYYFVSFTTALGETNVALTTAITIVSGSQTVTITGIPVSTDPRVTGRKIYRTRAGQTSDRGMVIATIADNTTTSYVDTAADSTFPNLGDWGAYRDNTTSSQITIDGTKAMALGTGVTSIGIGAGASITTAGLTTLVGTNAGNAITYGFQNTLVGTSAGRFVTTGSGNTVLGGYSLMWVTTGSDNIAIGRNTSFYNVTGSYNIAIGNGALSGQSGVSHSSNIGIGSAALYNLGAADNNVAIGYHAGRYISSGSNNTLSSNSIFIGYDARPNADSEANQIVIAYNGRGLGSNTTVIGNSSTTFTSIPAGNMTVGGTTNAGYKLDVQGTARVAGSVEVGANSAVQGGLSLYQKYTSSTNFLGSISTEYGSGAMILGYGAVGKSGVAGYVSSFDNFSGYRSAIKIGQATPLIVLGTSSAVATTVGSDITMNTLFQITNAGNVGIGAANPTQKLDVVGNTKLRGATFFGAISQPGPPTLTTNSTTGGTLAAATYYYRIVAVDFFNNTTTPSNELAVTTTGSTSSITISWPLVQGAYQYRIYRGTTSGGQNTYYTVSGTNAISFTDTGAAGTAGTTPAENLTSYGYYNTNGDFRSGNILIVNNGVGNTSSIIFDKSTDGPQINVTEYVNDGTLFEFSLRDNPDGPDAFHFVMPDWQNPSSGWKPFKFAAFTTQIVGQNTNFWSSFSMPSSTPYYTTNPESVANSQIKWDPYTSTTYNLLRDNGTGTGTLNVDVTGFTGTTNTIYWVTIASPTTFNWGIGWSGGTASGTGVTITGGWQVLGNGIQIRLTGTFVAADRWAFRVFPVPRMGIGTTTPIAPLQVSTTIAASSGTARGVYFNPTVVATANNDTLVGLEVSPTLTTGAFTGVIQLAARFGSRVHISNNNVLSIGGNTVSNDTAYGNGYITSFNQSFTINGSGGTPYFRLYHTTGNLVLQNGGTFVDAGYRLDVQGVLRVNGDTRFTGNSYITAGDFHLDNDRPIRWKDSAGNYRRAMLITAVNDFQFGPVDTGWAGQTYVKSGTGMQFLVNGASGTSINAISINSSANIGIGTTSPASKLTVLNTANTVAALIGGGAAAPGWVGIGTVNSGALPFIQGYNNAVSGTTALSINPSGGNVIVGGSTDAGYKLDVNGTFRAQGSITATLANTVTSSMVYYNSSTGLLTYGAVPTPTTFQIDYDYNIVGVKNGVNVVFTTSANFVLTTTRVYLNGQRLTRGVGYDYVETGTNQVTFANPLNPTDQIIIEYQL